MKKLAPSDLKTITSVTLNHYETNAPDFWEGTRDHDVTQNYESFLSAMPKTKGLRILDFGCGPGRDLSFFKAQGHLPTGLDGSEAFCRMAEEYSGCPVLHQNFLELKLAPASFDGVFANASLFHVPKQEMVRVLRELRAALVPEGVLFSSNPRGSAEGWSGDRYGTYLEWEEYEPLLQEAGFQPLHHYFRPPGLAKKQQPWLAVVSKAISNA